MFCLKTFKILCFQTPPQSSVASTFIPGKKILVFGFLGTRPRVVLLPPIPDRRVVLLPPRRSQVVP
jgi:hypothetical protein